MNTIEIIEKYVREVLVGKQGDYNSYIFDDNWDIFYQFKYDKNECEDIHAFAKKCAKTVLNNGKESNVEAMNFCSFPDETINKIAKEILDNEAFIKIDIARKTMDIDEIIDNFDANPDGFSDEFVALVINTAYQLKYDDEIICFDGKELSDD